MIKQLSLVSAKKMGHSCDGSQVPKHTEEDIEQERRQEEGEEVEDGDGNLCMNDRWKMELSGFAHSGSRIPLAMMQSF